MAGEHVITGTKLFCSQRETSVDVGTHPALEFCPLCGKILKKTDIVGEFQPAPPFAGDRPSAKDVFTTMNGEGR